MCVTLRLITIKFQIVTQNHWTSFLRNAIKVSFGWNFRIPLTPDQLPSWDHGGSHLPGERISVLKIGSSSVTSHILPVLVFFRFVRVLLKCSSEPSGPEVFTTPDGCPLFTSLSVATRDISEGDVRNPTSNQCDREERIKWGAALPPPGPGGGRCPPGGGREGEGGGAGATSLVTVEYQWRNSLATGGSHWHSSYHPW